MRCVSLSNAHTFHASFNFAHFHSYITKCVNIHYFGDFVVDRARATLCEWESATPSDRENEQDSWCCSGDGGGSGGGTTVTHHSVSASLANVIYDLQFSSQMTIRQPEMSISTRQVVLFFVTFTTSPDLLCKTFFDLYVQRKILAPGRYTRPNLCWLWIYIESSRKINCLVVRFCLHSVGRVFMGHTLSKQTHASAQLRFGCHF